MPVHKVTDFLSEISAFFKKDDVMINRSEEMNHICDIYKLKLAS